MLRKKPNDGVVRGPSVPKPVNSRANSEPKHRKPVNKIAIPALSSLLTILLILGGSLFLNQSQTAKPEVTATATEEEAPELEPGLEFDIQLSPESELWLDQAANFRVTVKASSLLTEDHTLVVLPPKEIKNQTRTLKSGTDLWEVEFSVPSMPKTLSLEFEVLDSAGTIVSKTSSDAQNSKTTTLPTECNLPELRRDYGDLEETGEQLMDDAGTDPSTFHCIGDSVGSWTDDYYVALGPDVRYSDLTYYNPETNKYQEWSSYVEGLATSGPYDYVETSLGGYPLLYDCYVPNEGDAEVMASLLFVHGIVIDYWNEGCLDDNEVYILEAALNVPVVD